MGRSACCCGADSLAAVLPDALSSVGLPRETHVVHGKGPYPRPGTRYQSPRGAICTQGWEGSACDLHCPHQPLTSHDSLPIPTSCPSLLPSLSLWLFIHLSPSVSLCVWFLPRLALFCHTIAAPFPVTCSSSCHCRRAGHHDNRDRPRF